MRKITTTVSILLIISLTAILLIISKSTKKVSEQINIKEEKIINLDLKCEEYNITTEEEFKSYLNKIIKQLKIPDTILKLVDFKRYRLEGTNFQFFTGEELLSSILGKAYYSIFKTILESGNNTIYENYPVTTNFIKKFNKEFKVYNKYENVDVIPSNVYVLEHQGWIFIRFESTDGSYWKYKYVYKFDNNYYLDDIYLDSKEMTHDSNGNAIPKPNSRLVDKTSFDLEILFLCLGNYVPEIWIYGNGDSDGSGYDLFHKEIALTENYKSNHQFKECLIPEKNFFYVDNAKNKDGIIANFEDGYVQLYAKFEDKDVLYDVKFETIDGYVDEINVATNSVIYKDNTSKNPINRMYNIHELNDIEYAGQNVFDD